MGLALAGADLSLGCALPEIGVIRIDLDAHGTDFGEQAAQDFTRIDRGRDRRIQRPLESADARLDLAGLFLGDGMERNAVALPTLHQLVELWELRLVLGHDELAALVDLQPA